MQYPLATSKVLGSNYKFHSISTLTPSLSEAMFKIQKRCALFLQCSAGIRRAKYIGKSPNVNSSSNRICRLYCEVFEIFWNCLGLFYQNVQIRGIWAKDEPVFLKNRIDSTKTSEKIEFVYIRTKIDYNFH